MFVFLTWNTYETCFGFDLKNFSVHILLLFCFIDSLTPRVRVTDISVGTQSPCDGYIRHSYFYAKWVYIEWISLRSGVVCAIMPTFRSPFNSCLTLAMADSCERDLCASQTLDATSQPGASPLTSTPHSIPQCCRRPPQ